jgi:hypothetical protein
MRLLNVETMKMEEFFDETVPPYAILSHRWGAEEVSFQEWNRVLELEDKIHSITRQSAFNTARHANDYYHEIQREKYRKLAEKKIAIRRKAGFSKILSCAELVRKQEILIGRKLRLCSYVWIDTCCIDKTNNAELSEAINSMFRWYQNSSLCLVHFADVPGGLGLNEVEDKVRASDWFERGWTLQELLAPRVVKFFDQSWEFLFNKESKAPLLAEITRIDEDILTRFYSLSDACTAKKMSWAASRTTTRKEDLAYCLLGIFGVNMPLLYGEGDNAFLRLQEEIIRQSGDLSIFAWGYHAPKVYKAGWIFAQSPADFVGCSNFAMGNNQPAVISMTNVTLSVRLSYHRPPTERLDFIYADLNCFEMGGMANSIFIPLVLEKHQVGITDSDDDTPSLRFKRPAGARPIPINPTIVRPLHGRTHWILETRTLSISKNCFEKWHPTHGGIFLDGLDLPSSHVVAEEVYPPIFWGYTATVLDFGDRHVGEEYAQEYDPVGYIRVSRRNNQSSQMVVVVRPIGYETIKVQLSEWSEWKGASLADFHLSRGLFNEKQNSVVDLEPGIKGKLFGEFFVRCLNDVIIFSVPKDSTGKS